MKKIRNTKQKIVILGYEIESGINFLPSDFFENLDRDEIKSKEWKNLIADGTIEVLS